jgi:FkbM family methyltransferase
MIESFLPRLFAMQARLSVAFSNFGIGGALKLFGCKLTKYGGLSSVHLRKPGRRFYFRGVADWGAMSHFYTPGYRIADATDAKVKIILDCGANIGTETTRFRQFHPDAMIISIEPEKKNFDILALNASGPKHVLVNAGLYNKPAKLRIVGGANNEAFRVEEVFGDSYDIEAVSIEHIVRQQNLMSIDILKLDIEGSEQWLFDETADHWISMVKVIICECPDNDAPGTTMLIYDRLLKNGLKFNTYIHGENLVLIRHDVPWKLKTDLYMRR